MARHWGNSSSAISPGAIAGRRGRGEPNPSELMIRTRGTLCRKRDNTSDRDTRPVDGERVERAVVDPLGQCRKPGVGHLGFARSRSVIRESPTKIRARVADAGAAEIQSLQFRQGRKTRHPGVRDASLAQRQPFQAGNALERLESRSSTREPVRSSSFNCVKPSSGSSVVIRVCVNRKASMRRSPARCASPLFVTRSPVSSSLLSLVRCEVPRSSSESVKSGSRGSTSVSSDFRFPRCTEHLRLIRPPVMSRSSSRVRCPTWAISASFALRPLRCTATTRPQKSGPSRFTTHLGHRRCARGLGRAVAPLPVVRDSAASAHDRRHGVALSADGGFPLAVENNTDERHRHHHVHNRPASRGNRVPAGDDAIRKKAKRREMPSKR